MVREYRLLAALADTDVPHARAIAGCDDPSVIGGCFYLMEFVDGWSPIQEGTTWPCPFDADLEARRALAFQLVDGIAKLSRVDWQARGLEGFGKPEGFHERQVDRWLAHLAAFNSAPSRVSTRRRLGCAPTNPGPTCPASCTATTSSPTSCTATAAGPPGRHRRLGDGHRRRSPARPGLGGQRDGPTTRLRAR